MYFIIRRSAWDARLSDGQDAVPCDGGVVEADTARSQGEETSGNADVQALGLDSARRDMAHRAVRCGDRRGVSSVRPVLQEEVEVGQSEWNLIGNNATESFKKTSVTLGLEALPSYVPTYEPTATRPRQGICLLER